MKFEKFARITNDTAQSLKIPELKDQRGLFQKFLDFFRGNTNMASILVNHFEKLKTENPGNKDLQLFELLLEKNKIGEDEIEYLIFKILEEETGLDSGLGSDVDDGTDTDDDTAEEADTETEIINREEVAEIEEQVAKVEDILEEFLSNVKKQIEKEYREGEEIEESLNEVDLGGVALSLAAAAGLYKAVLKSRSFIAIKKAVIEILIKSILKYFFKNDKFKKYTELMYEEEFKDILEKQWQELNDEKVKRLVKAYRKPLFGKPELLDDDVQRIVNKVFAPSSSAPTAAEIDALFDDEEIPEPQQEAIKDFSESLTNVLETVFDNEDFLEALDVEDPPLEEGIFDSALEYISGKARNYQLNFLKKFIIETYFSGKKIEGVEKTFKVKQDPVSQERFNNSLENSIKFHMNTKEMADKLPSALEIFFSRKKTSYEKIKKLVDEQMASTLNQYIGASGKVSHLSLRRLLSNLWFLDDNGHRYKVNKLEKRDTNNYWLKTLEHEDFKESSIPEDRADYDLKDFTKLDIKNIAKKIKETSNGFFRIELENEDNYDDFAVFENDFYTSDGASQILNHMIKEELFQFYYVDSDNKETKIQSFSFGDRSSLNFSDDDDEIIAEVQGPENIYNFTSELVNAHTEPLGVNVKKEIFKNNEFTIKVSRLIDYDKSEELGDMVEQIKNIMKTHDIIFKYTYTFQDKTEKPIVYKPNKTFEVFESEYGVIILKPGEEGTDWKYPQADEGVLTLQAARTLLKRFQKKDNKPLEYKYAGSEYVVKYQKKNKNENRKTQERLAKLIKPLIREKLKRKQNGKKNLRN